MSNPSINADKRKAKMLNCGEPQDIALRKILEEFGALVGENRALKAELAQLRAGFADGLYAVSEAIPNAETLKAETLKQEAA